MLNKNQIKDVCVRLANINNKNIYVKDSEKPLYELVSEDDNLLSRIEKTGVYDSLDIIWSVRALGLYLILKSSKLKN